MSTDKTEISVSPWALSKMNMWAAGNALTYMGHFMSVNGAGLLNTGEFNEMERWRKLSADLAGHEFEPMDPADGKIKNFDPAKVEDQTA